MRRALIVMVLAIAGAAGTAAQAQGNTINRLSGTFANDPNASLSFGVKVNEEGKPLRLTPLTYSNVDLRCKDGSVTEISGTVPGRKVDFIDGGQPFFVVGTADSGGPVTHFQGTLNRDSSKATGGLLAYTATFADGVTCATGQGPGSAGPDSETSFTANLISRTGTPHGGGTDVLTRHLTGRLFNDPNSSISFDVFVKDGQPVGISDVTYENLHMNCQDGSTMPVSGVVAHNKNLIPSRKGLAFNAGTPNHTMPLIHFTGYLSKSGKRAKGTFLGATEGLACTTGDGLGPARDVFKWFAN
jgi:hypothetical protein